MLCIVALLVCMASLVASQAINLASGNYVVQKSTKSLKVEISRSTTNGTINLGWRATPGSADGTNTSLDESGL